MQQIEDYIDLVSIVSQNIPQVRCWGSRRGNSQLLARIRHKRQHPGRGSMCIGDLTAYALLVVEVGLFRIFRLHTSTLQIFGIGAFYALARLIRHNYSAHLAVLFTLDRINPDSDRTQSTTAGR